MLFIAGIEMSLVTCKTRARFSSTNDKVDIEMNNLLLSNVILR